MKFNSAVRIIACLAFSMTTANLNAALLQGNGISYDLGDNGYPILYTGEEIHSSESIKNITFFKPFFGKSRARVNPEKPIVREGTRLTFNHPGEYYLSINKEHILKVVVLSRQEPISSDVLRIFDFLLANMVFCDGNDADWYADSGKTIERIFTRSAPLALLCGPSHELFRQLVTDRLALPSRIAEFPGAYLCDSVIHNAAHNVAEIYLPDVHKFVLFDINNAFATKWLSAIELSTAFHSVLADDVMLAPKTWRSLHLIVHNPRIRVLQPNSNSCKSKDQPINFIFDVRMLSSATAKDNWFNRGNCQPNMVRWLYGGVAYNGFWHGYGVDFLGEFQFASLHENPDLLQYVINWIKEWMIDVVVVSPSNMEIALGNGYKRIIESKPWLSRIKKRNIKKYFDN